MKKKCLENLTLMGHNEDMRDWTKRDYVNEWQNLHESLNKENKNLLRATRDRKLQIAMIAYVLKGRDTQKETNSMQWFYHLSTWDIFSSGRDIFVVGILL